MPTLRPAPLADVLLPFTPTATQAAALHRFLDVARSHRQPPLLPAAFPRDRLPSWFVGRWALLGHLTHHLEQWTQPVAPLLLTGPAGIGKTALAAHLMRSRRHVYDQLAWITITPAATAPAALDRLALDLDAGQPDQEQPDDRQPIPAPADTDGGRPGSRQRRGLLVIDHLADLAPDPAVMTAVADLQTGHRDLRVVVTARQGAGWPHATPITVGPLTRSAAVEFLYHRTGTQPAEAPDPAATIAAQLDDHPGALEEAGESIDRCGISLEGYLRLAGEATVPGQHQPTPGQDYAVGEMVWVPAENQPGTVNTFDGAHYVVSLVYGEVHRLHPDQLQPWPVT